MARSLLTTGSRLTVRSRRRSPVGWLAGLALGVCLAALLLFLAIRPEPVKQLDIRSFDISSRINGQTYRLWIYAPDLPAPRGGYPVLYFLDGNFYFGNFNVAAQQEISRGKTAPFILVGIGYPEGESEAVIRRRDLDLTLPVTNTPPDNSNPHGAADAFLRVLDKELKPFVAARYPVNTAAAALYGHSFGGLTALHELFLNPDSFSTYILSSPAIWWQQKEVLADEAAFSDAVRQGRVHAKVLILAGGDEQPATESGAKFAMIDNASGLADRLAGLNPRLLPVSRVIVPGEGHDSLPGASASRVIEFAIPPPAR